MSHHAAPTHTQSRRHLVVGRLVVGMLLVLSAPAQAEDSAEPTQTESTQTEPAQTEATKPALVRPTLETFAEAEYPAEAVEAEVEGVVVLIVTIDRKGQVTDAQVEQGLGHGLDEAARDAAMQFVFKPARRGDTPIPSRIRFNYEFDLAAQQSPEPGAEPAAQQSAERASTESEATETTESAPTGPASNEASDEQRAPAPQEPATIAVTVKGKSAGEQLQESARAVEVIDTEEASRESSDMGEVLARKEGVGVRRSGGLGSGTRFSLNGLNDKQVRFFLDGVPLEFAGFPMGIANVPVNLIDRVDVYSGVVPIHLGADALGGAVDLISPAVPKENGLRASYQLGSFSTHRTALSGHLASDDGLFLRGDAFFDYAENDYDVDVEVASDTGKISEATVERFHDGYRAFGGGVEVGVADKSWAERLSLRLFGSDLSRDLQHNLIMTVPYGEVVWEQTVAGATAHYEQRPSETTRLDFAAGYNYTRRALEDTSECLYDWYGRCVSQGRPGEMGESPSDRVIWEHAAFARLNAAWKPAVNHTLRLSAAPTVVTRNGSERSDFASGRRDRLAAQRDLFNFVTGLEYQVDLAGARLQNIAFVKDYLQMASAEEPMSSGVMVSRDRTTHQVGFGDSLRYRFNDWSLAKVSYEWATRLPTAEEIFGDAILVRPNLELEPERSHNVNVEVALDDLQTSAGVFRSKLTGFLRHADNYITELGKADGLTYQNVFTARAIGAEGSAGWTAPGGFADLDANATYVDLRNVSDEGAFGEYEGDRIPNRPYFYANANARLRGEDMVIDGDTVSLAWRTRYVHSFYRGWESVGRTEFKQVIPAQWHHTVALTHTIQDAEGGLSTTFEVQNLTDEKLYDFFGVQRPGRAFYVKTTLDF